MIPRVSASAALQATAFSPLAYAWVYFESGVARGVHTEGVGEAIEERALVRGVLALGPSS